MFFREWFVVFFVACFIGVIFLSQVFSCKLMPLGSCRPVNPPKIEVQVSGAVQRPGVYEVELGSTLQSILGLARLKKSADRSALYLKKKVLGSCSIIVPEKKCRKSKKKKPDSSSMAPTSYADENARNLSKATENICA